MFTVIFVSIDQIHSSVTYNFIQFYTLHLGILCHKIYMGSYLVL